MNTNNFKGNKIFWGGLICGISLVCIGCEKAATPAAAVQTVRAALVQEIRPEAPERYSATVAPFAQVELAFKSAGIVEQLGAQAGDYVSAGTELARVRQVDYQERVQQSQDQVRAAESQVSQLEVAIQQAETDYQRASRLYQSASLTKPEYEQAKTRLDSLRAQMGGARANAAAAQSVVSQANLTLADTSLRAPFSGWITARNIEKGSLVGNATPGFSMVDTHIVKAIFAVPDTSLKSIRMGQRLTVMLDALPHPVNGTVSAISPQADPRTHVFSVEVSIGNAGNEVRPGMIGSLALTDTPLPVARLVVPLSAVVRAQGNPNGFAVFRIQDRGGKAYAVAQSITPGATYGNAIEVVNGMSAGERIVGLGGDLLRDGQEVRVLP